MFALGSLKAVPGDVLLATHEDLATRTRTALAQAATKAAEKAAEQPAVPVTSAAHFRDLAASAARIFGWDNEKKGDTHNTMVISYEDLARIREAMHKLP